MSGDSDIEIIKEVESEWQPLERYLSNNPQIQAKLQEHIRNKKVASLIKGVRLYVSVWEAVGYNYESLKLQHFKAFPDLISKEQKVNFKEKLWKQVTQKKACIRNIACVSATQLVDRTFEHFEIVYKKRGDSSSPEFYVPTSGGSPKQPRGRKRSSDSVSPVAGPSGRQYGGQGARLSNVNTSSTLGPGLESRYNAALDNLIKSPELSFVNFVSKRLKKMGVTQNQAEIVQAIQRLLQNNGVAVHQIAEFYIMNKKENNENNAIFVILLRYLLCDCINIQRFGVRGDQLYDVLKEYAQSVLLDDSSNIEQNTLSSPEIRNRFLELMKQANAYHSGNGGHHSGQHPGAPQGPAPVPRYEEYRDTYVPALPLSDHPRDVDVRRHHSAMEATGHQRDYEMRGEREKSRPSSRGPTQPYQDFDRRSSDEHYPPGSNSRHRSRSGSRESYNQHHGTPVGARDYRPSSREIMDRPSSRSSSSAGYYQPPPPLPPSQAEYNRPPPPPHSQGDYSRPPPPPSAQGEYGRPPPLMDNHDFRRQENPRRSFNQYESDEPRGPRTPSTPGSYHGGGRSTPGSNYGGPPTPVGNFPGASPLGGHHSGRGGAPAGSLFAGRRGPHTPPINSPYKDPRAQSSSRFERIPSQRLQFKHKSNNLETLNNYLLRAKDQLTGKRSDYLIVALDMFFYGDGWSQNNILQLGISHASQNGTEHRLYVNKPQDGEFDQEALRSMGYQNNGFLVDDGYELYEHTIIPTTRELAEEFIKYIKHKHAQQDSDGVILVVLHPEPLIELIKILIQLMLESEFLKIVKGYCVLEPIIRNECIQPQMPDQRISQILAADIFGIPKPKKNCVHQQAVNVLKISNIMTETNILRDGNISGVNDQLVKQFKSYLNTLKDLDLLYIPLKDKLRQQLADVRDGGGDLCDPFPKSVLVSKNYEEASRVFIHALLYSDVNFKRLEVWSELDSRKFESRLFGIIETAFPKQTDIERRLLQRCVKTVVETMCLHREKRDSSRGRNKSGSSDTSEGSMPCEEREHSPIRDRQFKDLQTFLSDTMANDSRARFSRLTLINISNSMVKMLHKHFQNYPALKKYMEEKMLESCNHELLPHLKKLKGGKMNPTEFQAYSITDVIRMSHQYFNVRQSYSDQNFKGLETFFKIFIAENNKLPPDQVDSAVNQFLVNLEAAGYNFDRIKSMWDNQSNPELFIGRIAHAMKQKCGDTVAGFQVRTVIEWVARYCRESTRAPAAGGMKRKLNDQIVEKQSEGTTSKKKKRSGKKSSVLEDSSPWGQLTKGVEKELLALRGYCDKIKDKEKMDEIKTKSSKDIILYLAEMIEHKQLGFKVIHRRLDRAGLPNREQEKNKLANEIFTKGEKKHNPLPIHRKLLERFCDYQAKPELIIEDTPDRCLSDTEDNDHQEPLTIQSIDAIFDNLQKRSLKFRKEMLNSIPKSKLNAKEQKLLEQMHEFMIYNQQLLNLNHKAVHQTSLTAKKAKDFLVHILRYTSLTELSNEYRACREGCLSRNAIQRRIIELLRVNKLPESCSAISGLLASVTLDFFEQSIYAVPVKEQVMKINMKVDETNELKELQQYLFHVFIQEAVVMKEDHEFIGFELSKLDVDALSAGIHGLVNYLLDAEFSLYDAIENYIQGVFSQWLNKLLKGGEKSHPEGSYNGLIVRLCLDWIDTRTKILKRHIQPIAKIHRTKLKQRVAKMINDGFFVKEEYKKEIKVELDVPRTEKETLSSLEESGLQDLPDNQDNVKVETSDLTKTSVPGCVTSSKVIIIPPKKVKTVYGLVTGLPSVKNNCSLILTASNNILEKDLVVRQQKTNLAPDNTVMLNIENHSDSNIVQLETGFTLALVRVENQDDIESDSPGSCLQFVRYYYQKEGVKDILLKGSHFYFGSDMKTKMDKDRRTNFIIYGTNYSCGLVDYYTLEAVVYFVNMVEDINYPYDKYLSLALTNNKQVVREKDYLTMWEYLHGGLSICKSIDTDFTNTKNRELNFLQLQRRQLDSTVNANALNTDVKDSSMVIDEDKKEVKKDIKADLAKIDNPNKDVILQMKIYLVEFWDMKNDQAFKLISLLLNTLENLGLPLSQVRIDYFGVPNHRAIYQDILTDKIKQKLKESDNFFVKDAESFVNSAFQALKHKALPKTAGDLKRFLLLMDFIKEVREKAPQEILVLQQLIENKENSENITFDETTSKAFDVLKTVSSTQSCRPPTADDKIFVYTGFSNSYFVNVITQVQSCENVKKEEIIALKIRRMSPNEATLSRDEKEITGLIWGLQVNRTDLVGETVHIRTSNKTAVQVLSEDDPHSQVWRDKISEFQYNAQFIREVDNPALAYLSVDWGRMTGNIPVDTINVMTSLFSSMLTIIRTTTKNRHRWLKDKMKAERRQMMESIESKGLNPWDLDRDNLVEADTSSHQDNRINYGPDFIATGSSSGGERHLLAEESTNCPEFVEPSYQPLYKLFFNKLCQLKDFDRSKSKETANRVFTCLSVNGVSYSKLKDEIVSLQETLGEITQAQAKDHVIMILERAGLSLSSTSMSKELVQIIVEHFFHVLNIRAKIPRSLVNISNKSLVPTESEITDAYSRQQNVTDPDNLTGQSADLDIDNMTGETADLSTETGSNWFLSLMDDFEQERSCEHLADSWAVAAVSATGEQLQTGFEDLSQLPPSNVTERQTDDIRKGTYDDNMPSSGSLDPLEAFYDAMIKAYGPKDQQHMPKGLRVKGAQYKNAWIIAQVDYNTLKSHFDLNPGNQKDYIVGKYLAYLEPYQKLITKEVDLAKLAEWTYRFFHQEFTTKEIRQKYESHKERLVALQMDEFHVKEFSNLEAFLTCTMLEVHQKSPSQARRTARDCIQAIKLLGFKEEDYRELFHSAAAISLITVQLYDNIKNLFKMCKSLISSFVNIESLVKYSAAFYRAEFLLTQINQDLTANALSKEERTKSFDHLSWCVLQKLKTKFSKNKSRQIGHLVMKNRIQIPAEEYKKVDVKINRGSQFSYLPEGTTMKVVSSETLQKEHPDITVEEQEAVRYLDSLEYLQVNLENTNDSQPITLGHPTKGIVVGQLILDDCDDTGLENSCQQFAAILSDMGLDKNSLVELAYCLVKDTKGIEEHVMLTAVVAAILDYAKKFKEKLNSYIFQQYMKYAIYACLNSSREPVIVKKEIVDKNEENKGEEEQEEGEIADEQDAGDLFSIQKCVLPKFDKGKTEKKIWFPGTDYERSELINAAIKQVETVDIWRILLDHYPSININYLIDGKILVGKYLVDPNQVLEIVMDDESMQYTLQTIVLFLRFKASSHTVYIKKVKAQNKDLEVVVADHRKKLLKFLEEPESQMEELELLSKAGVARRLMKRYEELTVSAGETLESVPTNQVDESYQKLFARYFNQIYPAGFACQVNWLEASTLLAEQLLVIWIIGGYSIKRLIKKQRRAHEETNISKRNEKLRKLFKSYQRNLRTEPWINRNFGNNINNMIKDTIDIVQTILKQQENLEERVSEQRAIELSSDSEDELMTEEQQAKIMQSPVELEDDIEMCVLEMVSNDTADQEETADSGRKSADIISSSGRKSADSGRRSAGLGSDSGDEDDIGLVEVLKEKNQAFDLDELDQDSLKEKQEDLNRLLQVEQQEQDAALEASGTATNDEQDAELEASGATTNDEQVAAQETSGAADEPVHNTSGNSDATVANEEKQIPDDVSDASTKSPEYNISDDDEGDI